MASLIPDLPDEIIVEIFSRLPTKSAGKLRCLSKFWSSYLSTAEFINLHLTTRTRKTRNQDNYNKNSILYISFSNHYLHVITSPLKNEKVSKQIHLPNTTKWAFVHGSCNGLLLLQNTDDEMFLVNPVTLQHLKIPYLKKPATTDMFCFGYDSASDDYKVVRLSCRITVAERIIFLDVYSVRKATWKRVNNAPCPAFDYHNLAFANGAIHWLSKSMRPGPQPLIVAFDLECEVFREIPLSFGVCEYKSYKLAVLGECLCVSLLEYSTVTVDVWIMKEYGVVDSWIRNRIKATYIKPLCFISDDEFLYLHGWCNWRDWTVYNVKEQTTKKMVVDVVSGYYRDAGVFVDSLVNLDQIVSSSK